MPNHVINLRRARKARARQDDERRAAENRQRFGRTKAETAAEDDLKKREISRIDNHRIDRGEQET